MKKIITSFSPRVAMMLLTTLLLTMTAQTARADEALTSADFQIDNSIAEGTIGHYYLIMPTTGTNTLTLTAEDIAAGKGMFKVYDDGGKNGNYSNNCDGYLKIVSPSGYRQNVSGTLNLANDNEDCLEIKYFSGVLFVGYGTFYNNATPDYDKFTTDTQICFYSDGDNVAAGIDLNVVLYSTNVEYGITVKSATGGSVIASPTAAKSGDLVTLTATPDNNYILSGISVTDAFNNTIEVSGGTWYNNTATFTMPSTPATPVTVTPTFSNTLTGLSVNMPKTGSQTITVPNGVTSFKVYDDGGEGGKYSHNCDGTLTITAPDGYGLQLSGSVATISGDYLKVYNGTGTDASNRLGKEIYGEESNESSYIVEDNLGTLYSNGQSLTLYFYSDESLYNDGLDLTVTVIDVTPHDVSVETVSGGSVSANPTAASTGNLVTLTALPDNNYVLSGITVVDGNSNPVDVEWAIYSNTATFVMPASKATVTPVFTSTNDLTNISFNMPKKGHVKAEIPNGVASFNVYDDGGPSANYSDKCDGYLTLTAPYGMRFQMTGHVEAYVDDYLTIYDGTDNSAYHLGNGMYGSNNNGGEDIAMLTSSGRSLTLYFHSDNDGNNWSGFNLQVTVVDAIEFAIDCGSSTGNHIETDLETALPDQTVTLTAIHDADHILSGISVKDTHNNDVAVNWHLYADEATFTMPSSAVTVTPTFSDDLTNIAINMPVSGTIAADIPGNVASFHVYDDGGAEADHTPGCNGNLVLTAPQDYIIEVTGKVWTESDGTALLSIRNGAQSNSPFLAEALHSYDTDNAEQSIGTYTSTGRSLFLTFTSTSSQSFQGIDLTVRLIKTDAERDVEISNVAGGSVTADPTKAKMGDAVTLTAYDIDSNYLLNDLSVKDCNNQGINLSQSVAWYTNNKTATFTMPGSAVTVTPSFLPISDGLYINMDGNISAVIPSGASFVKVYDNGGVTGSYGNNRNSTLTLTAPDGCVLQLTGDIKILTNDYLSVYDGANTNATALLTQKCSDIVNMSVTTTDIGIITSSGQSMTLVFHSDDANYSDGLNLVVTPIRTNTDLAITINNATNGVVKVEGDATTAKVNETVTLKATPANGYVLGSLSVVDANSHVVPLTWNVFENTATFKMPGSAVTVTAAFVGTNPLTINIPAQGTVNATIPDGITSLKVYDNGGAAGAYASGCDGSLVLTAPEGYILKVEGTMVTNNVDNLNVYDGADTDANRLLSQSVVNNGVEVSVGPKVTTGRSMLLNFTSGSNTDNYAGLDLTVTVKLCTKKLGDEGYPHISYITFDSNGNKNTVSTGDEGHPTVYVLNGTEDELGTSGATTWYVVPSTATGNNALSYKGQLKLNGDVHLILADGGKMTADGTDDPESGHYDALDAVGNGQLTIYGQTNGTGELNAITGFGSRAFNVTGTGCALTICGGVVNAKADYAFNGTSLIIYGGKFTTIGATNCNSINTKNVQINGGEVSISGSIQYSGTGVEINGGQVSVSGSILSSGSAAQGIEINGGQVDVTGSIKSGGDIILGWSNDTDHIKAASYQTNTDQDHNVKIADGKVLKYTDGNTVKLLHPGPIGKTSGTYPIDGKTLTPYGIFGYCGKTDENDGKNVYWSLALNDDPETDAIYSNELVIEKNNNTVNQTDFSMADYDNNNASVEGNFAPWIKPNNAGTASDGLKYPITNVIIADGVTSVGQKAFDNCKGLQNVTIGNSVTSIGKKAFDKCSGLQNVTIGNSVTSIGASAFENCSGLQSVTIPASVTTIDMYAFGHTGLTVVTMLRNDPPSFVRDPFDPFQGCSNLKLILVSDETAYSNYNNVGNGWGTTYKSLLAPSVISLAKNASGWGTYCHRYPVNYSLSDGATAYTLSGLNPAKTAVTTAATTNNVVAPLTPLLLNYTAPDSNPETDDENVTLTAQTATATTDSYGAIVSNGGTGWYYYGNTTGTTQKHTTENDGIPALTGGGDACYILRNGTFVLVDTDEGIPAHRCVLSVGSSSAARVLTIGIGDETTAVESEKVTVNSEKSAAATVWYDLQGRKFDKQPTKKGLYINNGKKIVVK